MTKGENMKLCANMMVKNEETRIERCLRSLVPHVSEFVICDTGSEDKTCEVAENFLRASDRKCHVVRTTFRTWDQARNDALAEARRLSTDSDYLVLVDADMELAVAPGFSFDGLKADAYQMRQDSSTSSYMNVRLVRTKAKAAYHGVTHEFVAVEGTMGVLEGAWFVDHADGANRPGKFERDAKMLREGMEHDGMFLRYMFYLAQSHRDAGQFEEAMRWYAARSDAGGWEEEAWFSRHMVGTCALRAGKVPEFLDWTMRACATNPRRAEPWMALSTFFRDKGWHELCYMFAERASRCKKGNGLFVDRASHSFSPLMEMSVSGFYAGEEYKDGARKAAYRLLVEPEVPPGFRWRAMQNAVFYLRGAGQVFPGALVSLKPMGVAEGVHGECNPSIAGHPAGGLEMNVRSTNYEYHNGVPQGVILDGSGLIRTKNFYLRLDGNLGVKGRKEVSTDALGKPPYDSIVTGFEDLRLFRWKGKLFATAMSKRYNPQAACRQVLLEMSEEGDATRVLPLEYSAPGTCEKNWMPIVGTDDMMVIYKCHPFTVLKVGPETGVLTEVKKEALPLALDFWKGGSQALPYGDGWVFVVHESFDYPDRRRVYWHRMVYMDKSMTMTRCTEPFVFTKVGIEYCAGMAHYNGGMLMSFGVDDRKVGLCWVSYGSMEAALLPMANGG